MRGVLVADDFGLGLRHNQVILTLLETGAIDATSVMIDGSLPPDHLARLERCRRQGAQIGLHLNLTHSFDADRAAPTISHLLRDALRGRVPAALLADLARQAQAFQNRFDRLPDFYDGHQHVHCLPGFAAAAAALPKGEATWLRVPLPRAAGGLRRNIRAGGPKTLLVASLARAARRQFRRMGWRVNEDFSGFLRLDDPVSVRLWLPRLLDAAGRDCVIMVHPGAQDDPAQCPGHAAESRQVEAEILAQRSKARGS